MGFIREEVHSAMHYGDANEAAQELFLFYALSYMTMSVQSNMQTYCSPKSQSKTTNNATLSRLI